MQSALAVPGQGNGNGQAGLLTWAQLLPLIADFWRLVCLHLRRDQQTGRLKQWLNLLRRVYPLAQVAFESVKTFHRPADVDAWLAKEMAGLESCISGTMSLESAALEAAR